MRLLFFISCLLSLNTSAQSQQECCGNDRHSAAIEGRIINKEGAPAAGVKVKVTNHGCYKTSTTTDEYGNYKLILGQGRYEFSVVYKTGTEDSKNVIVYKGENVRVDFDEKKIKPKEVLKVKGEEDEDLPN